MHARVNHVQYNINIQMSPIIINYVIACANHKCTSSLRMRTALSVRLFLSNKFITNHLLILNLQDLANLCSLADQFPSYVVASQPRKQGPRL